MSKDKMYDLKVVGAGGKLFVNVSSKFVYFECLTVHGLASFKVLKEELRRFLG